jgi:hypothetical protein
MGSFIATENKDDCCFCDYKEICRDLDAATRNSERKLSNPMNVRIKPFADIRNPR